MSQINAPQDVFKKVHFSEMKALFREMAEAKVTLTVKYRDDEFWTMTAFRCVDEEWLYCATAQDVGNLSQGIQVVVNLTHENDNYFFYTTLKTDKKIPMISLDTVVYQLQRRKNSRLDIPEGYYTRAVISEINGQKIEISGVIKDISAGGCKLNIVSSQASLKLDDKITLAIALGSRRAVTYNASVRFTAQTPDNHTVLGIQYLEVDRFTENRLLMLMMDLHHEIQVKFSRNQK